MANLVPVGSRLIGSADAQSARRKKLELLELLDEKARRSMEAFTRAAVARGYLMGWVHQEICKELDQFLADVVALKSPRLILEAPPRHGKTELASRLFPAYGLGRYPDLSFIATSYGGDLASSINRDIQRIMDADAYRAIFPGSRLNGENIRTVADGSWLRNSDIFEIVDRAGVYKSSGVGGGITGRGMHVGIIDDPIKDAEEAYSQTVRDKIWEWYTSTFYTRLMPGGGILIILTRWHEDDLVGRILEQAKNNGEQWRVVRYPALAEENELHRKIGEPLHPQRYSLEHLERIRRAVGERVWNSLYQQRPSVREGSIFKSKNWQYVAPPKPLTQMTHAERKSYFSALGIRKVIQRWDTAIGAKKQNDLNACTTLGIADSRYYVIDVFQERMEYPELKRRVQLKYDQWTPNAVIVEGGGSASGVATVQSLKAESRIPIRDVPTCTDKVLRAELVSPNQESGLVYLFTGEPWVAKFVESCTAFPNIKHDDDVDSFVGAMEEALGGSKGLNISSELLARL
jgi:predicted phage terminase large subunit-like protein